MTMRLAKRQISIGVAVIVLAGLLVAGYRLTRSTPAPTPAKAPARQTQRLAGLDHVVIIVEENEAASAILGNSAAPYINQLAKQGALAANYYDVAKPSLPNYLALVGGTTGGITTDCTPGPDCQLTGPTIADRLEAARKSWKEYAESMPAPCTMHNDGRYAVRHNPFVYFTGITSQPARCRSHVVGYEQLASDLQTTDSLPDYVFITPNLCNDMHDCSVATGDTWLRAQVPAILQSPAFQKQRSLLVITWDEGSRTNHRIVTIFAGPAAKAGYVSHQHYDHYSLLRTIEAGFGVRPLAQHDAQAPAMRDMLRE